jgi:hypothetical protein
VLDGICEEFLLRSRLQVTFDSFSNVWPPIRGKLSTWSWGTEAAEEKRNTRKGIVMYESLKLTSVGELDPPSA